MKLSIIIPVLDSHKIVRRQIKHFKRMNLPNDIEILFMDDNSNPPLRETFPNYKSVRNFNIYPTYDKRPWSNACAKNMGAQIAEGEYLFITDIDHILPREAIDAVYNFTGDKMEFERQYAVLNGKAQIIQKRATLRKYGHRRKSIRTYRHTNTFAMKRKIFWEIGGYPEIDCNWGRQDHRDDTHLHNKYKRHCKAMKCKPAVVGPVTYVFPAASGDTPNFFHNLDRKIKPTTASTTETLDHICKMLDSKKRVIFTRFGDGEFWLMCGKKWRTRNYHRYSPKLQEDLKEAFSVRDEAYIKGTLLHHPVEPGMNSKTFLNDKDSWNKAFEKMVAKITNETLFYNAVVFHYMALFHPEKLVNFVDKYIKPKKKLFIGNNDKQTMEQFYGKIDYYVKTPRSQSYYSMDKWWPQVKKYAQQCEVILPSIGHASNIVAKRIWDMRLPVHCIDIGSVNDVLEGLSTRGWAKDVNKIKNSLIKQ